MISLKYVRIFQFENKLSINNLLDVCKSNRIPLDLGVAQSAYGWCDIIEPAILHSPASLPYLIGRFIGKVRSAPREMVSRELKAEMRRREREGESTTKDMERAIEGDIQLRLSEDLEPEILEGYVIITEAGEMFVTSKKRPVIDLLVNGLTYQLFDKGFAFKPKQIAASKNKLKLLATQFNALSSTLSEVVCKNSTGLTRLDPFSSANQFYLQTLSHSDIDRVTLNQNNMLFVTLTHKGTIHDIRFGEDFESEWRNYGDGEQSEMLDMIRAGLWLDCLTSLLVGTQMDIDRLFTHAHAQDDEYDAQQTVASPQQTYRENVVDLFRKKYD